MQDTAEALGAAEAAYAAEAAAAKRLLAALKRGAPASTSQPKRELLTFFLSRFSLSLVGLQMCYNTQSGHQPCKPKGHSEGNQCN